MTKVAIVGPTGVLGRELIPLLLGQGFEVRALARSLLKAARVLPPGIETAAFDLLSPQAGQELLTLLEGCQAAVHIATSIPFDRNAPGAWEANTRLRTEGTRRMLDASLKNGISRYIQQSITMAYPDHGEEWITESLPLDASPERSGLCAPVIAMEGMVTAISPDRMSWCILRGGTFTGPGTFQERDIAGLRSRTLYVPDSGRAYLSPVHVRDMARAVAAALAYPSVVGIFNIAAEPLRQGDYLDRLAQSAGAPAPFRDTALPSPASQRCSSEAAQGALGWRAQESVI